MTIIENQTVPVYVSSVVPVVLAEEVAALRNGIAELYKFNPPSIRLWETVAYNNRKSLSD
jgi:hypothetical protein